MGSPLSTLPYSTRRRRPLRRFIASSWPHSNPKALLSSISSNGWRSVPGAWWRMKAEELRTAADGMSTLMARASMRNAAASYQAMADRAEQSCAALATNSRRRGNWRQAEKRCPLEKKAPLRARGEHVYLQGDCLPNEDRSGAAEVSHCAVVDHPRQPSGPNLTLVGRLNPFTPLTNA